MIPNDEQCRICEQTIRDLIIYLEKHIEEQNLIIRLSNEVGNKDAGNRAGDIWAAYYGTLQQIPESLRQRNGEVKKDE